jgi:hypothetical protein
MNINRIIPLAQLTHLVIQDPHFSMNQLIELLRFSSNIQSLTFIGVSFIGPYPLLIEQISTINKVTELCIHDDCSLEYVRFFIDLCPRLQRLKIVILERHAESIVRFLLSNNVLDLFWLSLLNITYETRNKIRKLIDRDKLIFDYSIKDDYIGLHLWW